MKSSRPGLRPAQLTVIYALAAVLTLINQADGLAGWLDDLARSGQSRFHSWTLELADDVRSASARTGLSAVSRGESKILEAMTPKWEIGRLSGGDGSAAEAEPSGSDPSQATSQAPSQTIADDGSATLVAMAPRPQGPAGGAPPEAAVPETVSDAAISVSLANSPPPSANGQAENPDSGAPANPPTIYDQDLQALAIPLKPQTERVGFKSDAPIERVFLTGDSMMIEGIGPPLERYFKAIEGIEVSRKGQYSTGLCRLDYFDWPGFFQTQLAERKPDLVIITLGANDTQDIVLPDRKRHIVATEGWNGAYAERVEKMIRLAAEAQARILWLGLPIMGREPYNSRVQNLNAVTKKVCDREENCLFWDASASLTDKNGKYGAFVTVKDGRHVKVRAKDSIHLTDEGGKQMLADLLDDSPYLSPESLKNPTLAMAAARAEPAAESAGQADPAQESPGQVALAQESAGQNTASLVPPPAPSAADMAGAASGLVRPEAPKPVISVSLGSTGSSRVVGTLSPAAGQAAETVADGAADEALPARLPAPGAAPYGPFVLTEVAVSSEHMGQGAYLAAVPREPVEEKLPAVVLLHGAEGDQNYFSRGLGKELLELATRQGLIFIMPNGGPFGWYLDSPLKAESQMATHVMEEVLSDALARHPIDPERMAILGISMGGHGALTLALNNPGRFKAVSILSAVIDLESHRSDSGLDRYLKLHEILGPASLARDVWRDHSAYYLTRKKSASLSDVPILMSVGLSDKLCLAENRQYDRLLTDLGLKHWYQERSGGHDWVFWKNEFPTHLAFLAERLYGPGTP